MLGVKIVHCGDMHFDTPFSELSALEADRRKEELRETFGKIINIVQDEKAEILLISGDLFDNEKVMKTTIDYICKKMNEIKETYVFISPGNHDPYTEKSFYNIIQWPKNVYVFKNNLEKVQIKDKNIFVYGIGFSKPYERTSLLSNFHVDESNSVNVMVLHGDIVGNGQASEYNPITEEQIRRSGLDYLALGHRHKYVGVNKTGETFWAYSGNPEGRGFDETGSKGIIIGEIGKGYADLDFREVCKRKYINLTVDITDCISYEDICLKIYESIGFHDKSNNILQPMEESMRNLYKVMLLGDISEDFYINTSIIEDRLKERFYYVKVKDNTTMKIDYENLSNEFSLKGIFVQKMLQKINNTSDEVEKHMLSKALKLGIKSLDEKEVILDDN